MKTKLYRWNMNPDKNPNMYYRHFVERNHELVWGSFLSPDEIGNYSLLLLEGEQAKDPMWKMLLVDTKTYINGLVVYVKPEWVTALFPNK